MLESSLLALLLSAPSHAAVVAPSGARAWSAPIAATLSAAGLERLTALGSISLPRLAAPGADGRVPALASPELLEPLIRALEHRSVDPAAFSAMSTDEKLKALSAGAKEAEAWMSQNAESFEQRMEENRVSRAGFPAFETAVQQTRALSVYLDADAEASLAAAEKAVAVRRRARDEEMSAYLKDLPRKIAAGAFDGTTYLSREEDGARLVWRAADGHPDESYADPQALLYMRIARLGASTKGAWTVREAALLTAAVKHHVKHHQAVTPAPAGRERWAIEALKKLSRLEARGKSAAVIEELRTPLKHFAGHGRVSAADVRAIEKYYEDVLLYGGHPQQDWRSTSWIIATLQTGALDYPGLETLKAVKEAVRARMHRLALYAGGAQIAMFALMALAQTFTSGHNPYLLMIIVMTPIAVFAWALWQRDSLSYPNHRLEMLRRFFR